MLAYCAVMPKNLSEYISLSTSKPKTGELFFSLGKWLRLDVPFVKWKEPLRGRWARMARVLFSGDKEDASRNRGSETDISQGTGEAVCLCAHVKKCPIKGSQTINPLCPKFAFGICVEATLATNEGKPLSFASIGYLTGISKQRVEQIYSAAQQRLMDEIRKDPVLREYCENQGIGGPPLDNA
jgi:hypothetical protein